jgi:hypothetical protein
VKEKVRKEKNQEDITPDEKYTTEKDKTKNHKTLEEKQKQTKFMKMEVNLTTF